MTEKIKPTSEVGKLRAEKIGRRVFFNADVIDEAVNKGTVGRRGV